MRVDYKSKYQELKQNYINSLDVIYRKGYEDGLRDSQIDQAQQAQEQAMSTMQQNGQPGQPGEDQPGQVEGQQGEEKEAPMSENPQGDELGQHINKLEGMLGKSEISATELQDLKKTLNDIRSLLVQINLTKSMSNIKNTKMRKSENVLKISPKAQANLPEPAKKALELQHNILNNVFKKWESDESKVADDITSLLGIEGLIKKE